MNVLVIVNDQPYGSKRPYNALRLATRRATLEGLTDWALWAERTLTF